MKKKISRILGVVLTLALLSSLAMVAAPVAAQPGENEWDQVDLPVVSPETNVVLLEVAPDGTIFAGVYDEDADEFALWRSDDGYDWDKTELDETVLEDDPITAIACSPHWTDSSMTLYVGTMNGHVYRLEDAGDATPLLLIDPYANLHNSGDATVVWDLDVWWDGNYNWILAGTDIDVLVLKDDPMFEGWRDQDLSLHPEWDSNEGAYKVNYAPDFMSSSRVWAIMGDINGDYWVTSTVAPGQWGMTLSDVEISEPGDAMPRCDLAFATEYDSSTSPVLFVALSFDGTWIRNGDVYVIEAVAYDGECVVTPLQVTGDDPADVGMRSVEVSGQTILAGAYRGAAVYISDNGGATFAEAEKQPTGGMGGHVAWTYVVMAPGDFDPDEGVAYAATRGTESAFSISVDGAQTWNQTAFVDTLIDWVLDMAFSPEAASQPAILVTDAAVGGSFWHESIWRTADIVDSDGAVWERVLCTQISNHDDFYMAEYAQDGSAIMLFGRDGGQYQIWKSTDDGQTWGLWRNLPGGLTWIYDWVVLDGATIYAATEDGFYGTSRFGPAISRNPGDDAGNSEDMVSIALQPGFDGDDPDNRTLVMGSDDGYIYVSDDGGRNWGDGDEVDSGYVYVAFDAEDPETIYFATSDSTVGTAVIDDDQLDDIDELEADVADANDSKVATADSGFCGIGVSTDGDSDEANALYAIGYTGYVAEETTYGDPEAWGSLVFDIDSLFGTSNTAVVAMGGIDVEGEDSATTDTLYFYDSPFIVTGGSFDDWDDLDLVDMELNAMSDSVVAGTLFYEELGVATNTGYVDVVWVGLSGYTPGEEVVYDGWDAANIDLDGEYIVLPVMGETISDTSGDWTDNGGDSITIVSSDFDAVGADHVVGEAAVTNVDADAGNLSGLNFVGDYDIGPGFGGYPRSLNPVFDDYALECVVPETVDAEVGAEGTMYRLLLHEDDNVWETADIDGAYGLWLTDGSNIVWTIVNTTGIGGDEIWALEDTVCGRVTGVTASGIGEETATISWNAMTGAEEYEYRWENGDEEAKFTSKTTAKISGLDDNTDYTIRVRVAVGEPFSSRWSDGYEITTLEAIAAPCSLGDMVPENGMQNAPLRPSFVWPEVSNAVEYEFQLSTDPAFGTLIVNITTENTAYTLEEDLAYDTNHYWRVRAVSDTGTKSDWCFLNFHTRMEEIPPVTVEPAPTPEITLPQPTVSVNVPDVTVVPPDITVEVPLPATTITTQAPPQLVLPEAETPAYIWAIVAIGALLTIAVIVLIIRTRRVV